MSTWFRLYVDLPNCVKLRRLPPETQLAYVWCLCLHKEGHLVGKSVSDIAWQLRIPEDQCARMLSALVGARLLGPDHAPTGWQERQFSSDCSTPRVQAFRDRKRGSNGGMKRQRNVSETLITEQSRAEQNREKKTPVAATAAAEFPIRELTPDDTAETAYQCLCAIRPEYANLNMSAFYNAWKTETEPTYRCRAFNECLMKLAGAIETHKEPLALLAGYLRNARTKSTGPRTSDLASVIDPVDE